MKKIKTISSKKENLIFFTAFFLCVTFIAFFFPPSADDLGWATSDGRELLERGFADYNGRYLGNLCALFLTRIPSVLPFIKALTLTLILDAHTKAGT